MRICDDNEGPRRWDRSLRVLKARWCSQSNRERRYIAHSADLDPVADTQIALKDAGRGDLLRHESRSATLLGEPNIRRTVLTKFALARLILRPRRRVHAPTCNRDARNRAEHRPS
jgi:hypothetical protein